MKLTQEPGQQLRRAREQLRLKYRDVEEASRKIATRHRNDEFFVGLSRLADIENRGTVPSIYRLYSLCAIYSLDLSIVLVWYGIELQQLPADAARSALSHNRAFNVAVRDERSIEAPDLIPGADLRRTSFLSREIQRWGKLPLVLLKVLDLQRQKYGFLGTEDWSMYPILAPGSFLQIDESKCKITQDAWTHELQRPIYFLEHREGYRCGWCTLSDGTLILQPHWSSKVPPQVFRFPGEIEVVGQVVGVAMRLDLARRHHTHS